MASAVRDMGSTTTPTTTDGDWRIVGKATAAKPPKPHVLMVWHRGRRAWVCKTTHPSGTPSRSMRCRLCDGGHSDRHCEGRNTCATCGEVLCRSNPGQPLPGSPFRICKSHHNPTTKATTSPTASTALTASTDTASVASTYLSGVSGHGAGAGTVTITAKPPVVPTGPRLSLTAAVEDAVLASCLRGDKLVTTTTTTLDRHGHNLTDAMPHILNRLVGQATTTGSLLAKQQPWLHPSNYGALLAHMARNVSGGGVALLAAMYDALGSVENPTPETRNDVYAWVWHHLYDFDIISEGVATDWHQHHSRSETGGARLPSRLVDWYAWLTEDSDSDDDDDDEGQEQEQEQERPAAVTTPTPAPTVAAVATRPKPVGRLDWSGLAEDLVVTDWADLVGMDTDLLRGCLSAGYDRPSKFQARALGPMLRGGDVIAQAPSGSGKTAAFGITSLSRVNPAVNAVQAIIVAPTQELAVQSHRSLSQLSQYMEGVDVELCCGGGDARAEAAKLRRPDRALVVVATPGRLLRLLDWNALDTRKLGLLVLDEADEVVDHFTEDLKKVFEFLEFDSGDGHWSGQLVMTSATMTRSALDLSDRFMESPTKLLSEAKAVFPACIQHFKVDIASGGLSGSSFDRKMDYLLGLVDELESSGSQAIVFVNANSRVEQVAAELRRRGVEVSTLSGGRMTSLERAKVIGEFEEGKARLLLASDVVARGLDVQTVRCAINFDVPRSVETYVHRVGRAGRFGRRGAAVTFVQAYRDQHAVMDAAAGFLPSGFIPELTLEDVKTWFGGGKAVVE